MRPARIFWAAAALLLAMASHSAAAELRVVRLSFTNGWNALPALVAIERGFFAQEGLVVSGLAVPSVNAIGNSLLAGSSDLAILPQRNFLKMAQLKMPIRAISISGWDTQLQLVVPESDTHTKSLNDLKGKSMALGVASNALPAFIRLLNQSNMTLKDVEIRFLDSSKLTQVFPAKIADAIFETRHFTDVMTMKKLGRVAVGHEEIKEKIGLIQSDPLLARQEFIEKEPETVQRFVNAWIKALQYIQQDSKDASRVLTIFFHRLGVASVDEKLAHSWVTYSRHDRYFWSESDIADAKYNAWGLKEAGQLKAVPEDLEKYIDNRFARKAMEKLKAELPPSPAAK